MAALAGAPVKTIGVTVAAARFKGEAILSAQGLEGGAIYAAGASIRKALRAGAPALIHLDLQPQREAAAMAAKLASRDPRRSLGPWLQKTLGLSAPAARLIAVMAETREPEALGRLIKAFPVAVRGMAPIARAISTAGGLNWDEVDQRMMLKRRPGVFVAGDMLDWVAPTGGYLLQACLATGRAAGQAAAAFAQDKAAN